MPIDIECLYNRLRERAEKETGYRAVFVGEQLLSSSPVIEELQKKARADGYALDWGSCDDVGTELWLLPSA